MHAIDAHKCISAFTIVAVFGFGSVFANVRLPKVVGDNMVLQRDSKLMLWGWADSDERVTIVFRGQRVTTKADDHGRWSTSIGPFTAGGPYEMLVKGRNAIHLHNILVGDVWFASGQSNMEFPLQAEAGSEWKTGVNGADKEVAGAYFPRIRLFTVERNVATDPQIDVPSKEGWRSVTPESAAKFSAVAYLFGRELHKRYGIPVGLIHSSWGGTAAETWMSGTALETFPEFQTAVASLAQVTDESRAAYDRYIQRKAAWYKDHATTDRGRVEGRDAWADPNLNTHDWPEILQPRPDSAWGKDFNGFGGVVWFRREIAIPAENAGRDFTLKLGRLVTSDTTFFNGYKVGETKGPRTLREYAVPGEAVRRGSNVIVVRLVGTATPEDDDVCYVGMAGPEDEMVADFGTSTVSLAGKWSYQSGPDLKDLPVVDAQLLAARPSPEGPQYSPAILFNGMIHPLTLFRIRGVIWYQGESNAIDNRAAQYRRLFPALIEDWRHHWGYNFPFLFVQLAGFGHNQPHPADYPWAELREAQSAALSLPNTGMVTTVDIGDEEDIHPKNKQDVAHRLALSAAKVAYGENIIHTGPTFKSIKVEGDRIRVQFSNLGSGLLIKDKYGYARGFEVASADGKFRWAQARREGQDILVFSEEVQEPSAVRYDWSNTPDGNVFNKEGLPAPPFRTAPPPKR